VEKKKRGSFDFSVGFLEGGNVRGREEKRVKSTMLSTASLSVFFVYHPIRKEKKKKKKGRRAGSDNPGRAAKERGAAIPLLQPEL